MHRLISIVLACAGCASLKPSDLGLPPLSSTAVYTGPERIRVEVLELGAGDRALIKVDGISGEIAGLVLEHTLIKEDSRARWVTPIDGTDFATLWRESPGGRVEWHLRNPEDWRTPFAVQYDEAASRSLDPVPIYELHRDQREQGVLSKLATFDRKRNETEKLAELDRAAESTSAKCGASLASEVEWSTISDEVLKKHSVSGYCEPGLTALSRACESPSVRAILAAKIKKATCRLAEAAGLALEGDTLAWTTSLSQSNQDEFAWNAIRAFPLDTTTIGDLINLDATQVCTDTAKKHFVSLAPEGDVNAGGLSYGDGKSMTRLPVLDGLGAGWFLDPRQVGKNRNSNFRGYDLRFYGRVEVDDKGACTALCGDREVTLTRLAPDEKKAFLKSASFIQRPDVREPYAIARDEKGVYYYVDRGSTPELAKDFRLFVGKRGQLKKQKMKDIVSDSRGEIFSSSSGELRLVLGRSEAQWIRGSVKQALTLVPVQENLGVIYNELGVYLGARLHTPCDDL